MPGAGSSSIVYCALEPGIVRQLRGSVPEPDHAWFTGLGSLPEGGGTLVHLVQ